MVSGKDQELGFFIVSIADRVLASILFASAALEALFAFLEWPLRTRSALPQCEHLTG